MFSNWLKLRMGWRCRQTELNSTNYLLLLLFVYLLIRHLPGKSGVLVYTAYSGWVQYCKIDQMKSRSPLWRPFIPCILYLTQLATSGFHQLIWAIEKPSSQEEKRERSRSWTRTLREKHQITSLREGVSDADIRTSSCLQINQPVTTTQRLTHN